MRWILRGLVEGPRLVAALALFGLMGLTFADVMLRSLFNAPIQAGADMTRLLMAVAVFSVMPTLSWNAGHIAVDLMDSVFRSRTAIRLRGVLVDLVCGLVLIYPAERIWALAERSRSYGDVMEYLGLPVHYLGWFIAVMTGLTAATLIVRAGVGAFAPRLLEGRA